ncbi:MAG: hypothetical protein RL141_1017 [Candidatus Parcubacteria bacterium]
MAGDVTRNAEANADDTFEKTLAVVFVGPVLRDGPELGLQVLNEQSVNARHPQGVIRPLVGGNG